MTEILRYTAFSSDPSGGNRAGVVLDARGMSDDAMLAVAADVGYSETVFVTGRDADGTLVVRYFSPRAEVDFCGHVTIALGVAYAERHGAGTLSLRTAAGPIALATTAADGAPPVATLTSVPTHTRPATGAELSTTLGALRWPAADLDASFPPHVAFGGNEHLVLAAATRERLADLDYDYAALDAVMAERAWTTVQLVWRESATVFHARDPFPPGGVVEDAATGAAAAAFGGYLRDLGLFPASGAVTIHQGADMGRPSLLTVTLADGGRVSVGGTAVPIT
ncbi:MAG TPA: PhzF family phenazine biosynthesis isomerase [Streptosporangiaceae bacterium]|jgi:PhzF family phenazine biosynthesis protein